MMQVYEYLLEGVTAPPAVKKRLGLFRNRLHHFLVFLISPGQETGTAF